MPDKLPDPGYYKNAQANLRYLQPVVYPVFLMKRKHLDIVMQRKLFCMTPNVTINQPAFFDKILLILLIENLTIIVFYHDRDHCQRDC